MNTVKFSAYRLALKLRKVQQRLCLDLLDIASAEVCFDSHGLTAEKHDLTICVPEMVTVLTSIYETLHQCEPEDIDVSLCVDLALNWILNVFDSQRQGFTRVLSFKLAVVVLCRGPLLEKYSILYTLAAQGEEMLDQRRLGLLLYDLVQAPRYLGEVAQFGGSNIEPSVRSCLSVGAKEARGSINQEQFLQWAKEEPQSLVWLPVLHRLASAETATHDVKCKICRVYPIVGFRYHCRKCFNLDICHGCFFVGKTYKGHKPEHPMQEYCTATNKTDNARHILQAVRNSFRSKKYFKKKQQQLGYLPVQTVAEGESFESPPSVLSPTGDFLSPNLSFESREFVPSDSAAGSVRASEDDEHSLIAAYCRLLTTGGSNENNNIGGASTASILHDVDRREENSRLEKEHRALLAGTVTRGESTISLQTSEEKALRQQRARLEARMAILEDHNRQLEAQLDRLRQLVTSGEGGGEVDELGSVVVVAAELKDPATEGKKEPVVPRPAPPTTALRSSGLTVPDSGSGRSSVRDSGTSGDTARHSATSGSLDLSIHNTEVQDD
jgi:dystrophin